MEHTEHPSHSDSSMSRLQTPEPTSSAAPNSRLYFSMYRKFEALKQDIYAVKIKVPVNITFPKGRQ